MWRLSTGTRDSNESVRSARCDTRPLAPSCDRTAEDAKRLLRAIEVTIDLAINAWRDAASELATRVPVSSPVRNATTAGTPPLQRDAERPTITHARPGASYGHASPATRYDIALLERAGMHLLQQIWGLDDCEARQVLHAAGMRIDIAVDAWLDSGEQLVKNRHVGAAAPPNMRLAMALRTARQTRLAIATRFARERTIETTRVPS